jgi:nucleotide-binding universal stress UspA family protein
MRQAIVHGDDLVHHERMKSSSSEKGRNLPAPPADVARVDAGDGLVPRIDRIAVAVDFGSPSIEAARWVAEHLAPDAELPLIHALDVAAVAQPGVSRPTPDALRTACENVLARLREIADSVGGRAETRVEIREDRPAPGIMSVAEAMGADVIVVGPHGGKESIRGIGSTAERLIRMSPIPILLVANPRARATRHLLIAVDQANLTPAVIKWADRLALIGNASVTLVHVLDPRWQELSGWQNASSRLDVNDPSEYPTFQDFTQATERWLADLSRGLTDRERVTLATLVGVPGNEIAAAARHADADLVVMGRRGRGSVLPAILGSAVSMVLRQAPCPVFIVPDRPDAI